MPDRRQADRRENGGNTRKEITISLTMLITVIVFFLLIIAGIIFCEYFYKLGYENGSMGGYAQGYTDAQYELNDYEQDEILEYDYDE